MAKVVAAVWGTYRNTELVSVLLFIHIFKSSWCGMELNQSPNSSNVIAVSSVWLFSYSMLVVDCRDDVLLQNRHLIKNRHDAFRISKTNTLGVFDILSHFSWISILIKVTNCTQIYKYIHTVGHDRYKNLKLYPHIEKFGEKFKKFETSPSL